MPLFTENALRLSQHQMEMILSASGVSTVTRDALWTTDRPFSDPRISCSMCYVPYHTPNEDDGSIELPCMTVCGHVFGYRCFLRWHTECEEVEPLSLRCPTCRLPLQFLDCAHNIAPLPAWKSTTPEPVKAEDMPKECLRCEHDNLIGEYKGYEYEVDSEGKRNGGYIGTLHNQKVPLFEKLGKYIAQGGFDTLFHKFNTEPHITCRPSGTDDELVIKRAPYPFVPPRLISKVLHLRKEIKDINKEIARLGEEFEWKLAAKTQELSTAYDKQNTWKIPFFIPVPFNTNGTPFLEECPTDDESEKGDESDVNETPTNPTEQGDVEMDEEHDLE